MLLSWSTIEEWVSPMMSCDTSASSLPRRIPRHRSAAAAATSTVLTSSASASRDSRATTSQIEPSGTGTRSEIASIRPASSGITSSVALAALAHRGVRERLAGGVGVDGRHHQVLDPEGVVEHPRDRRQAVGGAGGHGDDDVFSWVVGLVVDPGDEGAVDVVGRRRDDDPLGAADEVEVGLGAGAEGAARLDDHLRPEVAPGDVGRVLVLREGDGPAVHVEGLTVLGDLAR